MVSEVYYEVHTARISNVNSVMFVHRIREMESSPCHHLRQCIEKIVENMYSDVRVSRIKIKSIVKESRS